jgi:plasmid stability protein
MASVTIRNLDESLKRRIRIRAAQHGRSMEAEARDLLRIALEKEENVPTNFVEVVRRRFAKVEPVDLTIPPREPMRG